MHFTLSERIINNLTFTQISSYILLTNNMLKHTLDTLLEQRPFPAEEIVETMISAAHHANLEDFESIVGIAKIDDTPLDYILAVPAIALLPAWGEIGINELIYIVQNGPHSSSALGILAAVAQGDIPSSKSSPFLGDAWDDLCNYILPPDIPAYSKKKLRAAVLEQFNDELSRRRIVWNLSTLGIDLKQAEIFDYIFDLLIDSRLILNESILAQFEELLESDPKREEELHQFLLSNPILLDPFVIELRNKHELGDDFITDFVIRRINNKYVLVEIENSTDHLFRQNGSFTSKLMQAIAQVRDFQAWISDNISYAQTKLPGIRHPEGLVVIGRMGVLTPTMKTRLDEENFSRRGHILIMTYDDLLYQAKAVYKNILEKPTALRSRDQRSI